MGFLSKLFKSKKEVENNPLFTNGSKSSLETKHDNEESSTAKITINSVNERVDPINVYLLYYPKYDYTGLDKNKYDDKDIPVLFYISFGYSAFNLNEYNEFITFLSCHKYEDNYHDMIKVYGKAFDNQFSVIISGVMSRYEEFLSDIHYRYNTNNLIVNRLMKLLYSVPSRGRAFGDNPVITDKIQDTPVNVYERDSDTQRNVRFLLSEVDNLTRIVDIAIPSRKEIESNYLGSEMKFITSILLDVYVHGNIYIIHDDTDYHDDAFEVSLYTTVRNIHKYTNKKALDFIDNFVYEIIQPDSDPETPVENTGDDKVVLINNNPEEEGATFLAGVDEIVDFILPEE